MNETLSIGNWRRNSIKRASIVLGGQRGHDEIGIPVRIEDGGAEQAVGLFNVRSTTRVHTVNSWDAVEVNDTITLAIIGGMELFSRAFAITHCRRCPINAP